MTSIEWRKILTSSEPVKSLTKGLSSRAGRNSAGRITMGYKGGGHKRLYRELDFSYEKRDVPAVIRSVEYDPNRSGLIGLACYKDGDKRYVLLPQSMKVGDEFVASMNAEIKVGNKTVLSRLPAGTFVFNIEVTPNSKAKLVRSAGSYAEVIAQDNGYTLVKMPSTEVRKFKDNCWATIGAVSNEENWLVNIGKAGRNRWLGVRPKVRGSARNPVDHPYGGGEGRQGRGRRRAITRTGKPVGKGQKSRKPKKYSNNLIVARRVVGQKKSSKSS
jgi:large subunit ribosomal protein L2